MFDNLVYEFRMHRLLKRIAKQRIEVICPPNIPLIERAISNDEKTQALLLTAQIRGWVELLHQNVAVTKVRHSSSTGFEFQTPESQNIWRLTDSGWGAIQRRHQVTVLSLCVALVGLYFAVTHT